MVEANRVNTFGPSWGGVLSFGVKNAFSNELRKPKKIPAFAGIANAERDHCYPTSAVAVHPSNRCLGKCLFPDQWLEHRSRH